MSCTIATPEGLSLDLPENPFCIVHQNIGKGISYIASW